jgi:histidine triad (HIT) family protein
MDDCLFCKIVQREIPARIVYENDDYVAFLDVRPRNPGHVLVIPKKHYVWVWDVPNIGSYMEVAQQVANAQRKAFDTDWVVSAVFGEEVPHAHIWLVPRFEGDGHGGSLDVQNIKSLSDTEMDEAAQKIRDAVG